MIRTIASALQPLARTGKLGLASLLDTNPVIGYDPVGLSMIQSRCPYKAFLRFRRGPAASNPSSGDLVQRIYGSKRTKGMGYLIGVCA